MKKFYIDHELVSEEKFYQTLEEENDNLCNDTYDDMLDECHDVLTIGYCTFYPSQVLYNCDPVAYRCGLSDYKSSQYDNLTYELEHYNKCCVNGFDFEIEENEEE